MKKNVMLISVFLLMSISVIKAKSSSINWITSFDDAKKMSKALNKPILLDFTALWCGPCKKMDREVWNRDDIKQVMQNFISVKIDLDSNTTLASKYSVKAIPNIFILDGYGNVLYSTVGYKDKNKIRELLEGFSVNLANIHMAQLILEKDEKNIYSNLRVAQKFQDASFVLNGDSKKAFLNRSNYYLKVAKKLVPKDKKVLTEKINLLKLYNKAGYKNYKGALKSLAKDFENINESNKALSYFIKFYCYHFLEEDVKAQEVLDDLNALQASKFVKKAHYLLEFN